jgi:hypothetical protein
MSFVACVFFCLLLFVVFVCLECLAVKLQGPDRNPGGEARSMERLASKDKSKPMAERPSDRLAYVNAPLPWNNSRTLHIAPGT